MVLDSTVRHSNYGRSRSTQDARAQLAAVLSGLDGDIDTVAKDIIAEFGDLSSVLIRPANDLANRFGRPVADRIEAVRQAAQALVEDRVALTKVSRSDLVSIARSKIAHDRIESVIAFLLDAQQRLICVETVSLGNVGSVDVCVRSLIAGILRSDAKFVVLAHNHPSGDPTPSTADRQTTQTLTVVLQAIGVQLLEHFIVSETRDNSVPIVRGDAQLSSDDDAVWLDPQRLGTAATILPRELRHLVGSKLDIVGLEGQAIIVSLFVLERAGRPNSFQAIADMGGWVAGDVQRQLMVLTQLKLVEPGFQTGETSGAFQLTDLVASCVDKALRSAGAVSMQGLYAR